MIKKFILLTLISILLAQPAFAAEMQAITHPSAEQKQLSTLELRRIFSKRVTKWPNGLPIVVFVLPSSHTLHQRFTKEVLKIFPYQLDRIWNKMTYSGVGTAPIVVSDYESLLREIQSTPGAIGYGEITSQEGGLHVIQVKK